MVFRIVLMVILNASIGLFLKSFLLVHPIFSFYQQIIALSSRFLANNPKYMFHVHTCEFDPVCSTFVTIGRSCFLVDLSISFFFFLKFDRRFKERFECLITNIKNEIKRYKFYKYFNQLSLSLDGLISRKSAEIKN